MYPSHFTRMKEQAMEQFLPYINIGMFVLIALGGVMAFRYSIARTSSLIQ